MLPESRQDHLMQQVRTAGGIRTAEAAAHFGVSVMTIWRDLEELEKKGVVRRVHGGARPAPPEGAPEPAFSSKALWMPPERVALSRYAAQRFGRPGTSLTLEGGSTAVGVLAHLPGDHLTVLTNSIEVLRAAPKGCSILASGGEYRSVSGTFVGEQAISFFQTHRADFCLLSATGFDEASGLTDPNPSEIAVKRAMREGSATTVLLLDSLKFGKRSVCPLMSPQEIDILVTNESAPEWGLKIFRQAGCRIELV
jgi:DeoR family fructose operon transcriptional repressor